MKGRLISNTGPIIALCSIDRLKILKEIFEEIVLPETLHDEGMDAEISR
jgi:predicted nucleic acid-binding protein